MSWMTRIRALEPHMHILIDVCHLNFAIWTLRGVDMSFSTGCDGRLQGVVFILSFPCQSMTTKLTVMYVEARQEVFGDVGDSERRGPNYLTATGAYTLHLTCTGGR